jgi:two-component system, NarL family, nitrate/nitrite response regulator NarL
MQKIRILLIEDNRIIRDGITAMINSHGDVTIASVSNGRDDALVKVRSAKPHLILIDFSLDSQDSLDIVETVKRDFPLVKIVGMGIAPSQPDIRAFVQAGTDGFILKNATLDDVLNTIRAVAGGAIVLPPAMTASLFFQIVEHGVSRGKKSLNVDNRMTQREKEVIALIAEGMSNKQIASDLNIATFTVKSHVHNILEKLALNSRLQIANHARD